MTTISSLSPNVQAILHRARDMSSDGVNTNKEVGQLFQDIIKLQKGEQEELTSLLTGLRDKFSYGKEPLEAFLDALRTEPSQLIARLSQTAPLDVAGALKVAAQLMRDGKIDGTERMSVHAMMLVSKMEPEALKQMGRLAEGRAVDVDSLIRPMLKRGLTTEDVVSLAAAVGKDAYGSYELNYWAQTTRDSDFKDGAKDALHRAAAYTWPNVTQHYREDLELNRGRGPSSTAPTGGPAGKRGLEVLTPFLRDTLGLDATLELTSDQQWKLTVRTPASSQQQAQGETVTRTFASNDDLAAFAIARSLEAKGRTLSGDGVTYDKAQSKYVLHTPQGEKRYTFHTELLRAHGFPV